MILDIEAADVVVDRSANLSAELPLGSLSRGLWIKSSAV